MAPRSAWFARTFTRDYLEAEWSCPTKTKRVRGRN
jgi:hypothetical protein